jgi:hypothetical protein
MLRRIILIALMPLFFLAGRGYAADIPLTTAHGVVERATKDSLTFLPRRADGKFDKSIALKITGTSKITIVGTRMQGKNVVVTQREAEPKDLAKNQQVAVIFAKGKDGNILLAAVVQPSSK